MSKNSKIISLVILIVGFGMCILFGFQKRGYYIDEYYTYTLANGTQLGIDIKMNEWNKTNHFLEQLVSTADENFRFDQTYVNNSNDVHPPTYYYLIHAVSSFFPGVFSKWIGIGVNIFLWILCFLVLELLAYKITKRNEMLTLICLCGFALSPCIISGVMLARMYVQLQLFVLLYACIIVKDLQGEMKTDWRFYISVALVGFGGFLTQYYFVIAMFFMTFFYGIHLFFIKKEYKKSILFGMSALAGLIATYFVWPSSFFHIFKGYRGTKSVESLLSVNNITNRFNLYVGNLNKNVFGGMLIAVVLISVVCLLVCIKNKIIIVQKIKDNKNVQSIIILALSSASYFIIVAKIGLKSGDASNRYEYPIYGLFILLTIIGIYYLTKWIICHNGKLIKYIDRANVISCFTAAALFCIMIISAFALHQVLYLYSEEQIIDKWREEHPDSKMVVFCDSDGDYDTRIKDYLAYDEVYFADCSSPEKLSDPSLGNADSIVLYLDNDANQEECLKAVEKLSGIKNEHLLIRTKAGKYSIWAYDRAS